TRAMLVRLIGLSGVIDLGFEAGIHGEPGRIASDSRVVETSRWRVPRIAKTNKYARVVALRVDPELETQREVRESLSGIEQEANFGPGPSDENLLSSVVFEVAGTGLLPI